MPELHGRVLGNPPKHKILDALQQTGSRLVGDQFFANDLADCIHLADGLGRAHKLIFATEGQKRGAAPGRIESLLAQAEDNLLRAAEMKAEDYHCTNALAFLSFRAARQAGSENIVAAILSTILSAAMSAADRFASGKYDVANWPWPEEQC